MSKFIKQLREKLIEGINGSYVNPSGLVNLQYDGNHEALTDPGIDLKNDIEGVVALCAQLARVVCVPTSIIHIAGAIGAKVEVVPADEENLIRNQLNWSEVPGRSLWYPNVHVYRSMSEWKTSLRDFRGNTNQEVYIWHPQKQKM